MSSGVATAAAAYGLVGTLASASTGTAISALSGLCRLKSATLAWLGGGTLAAGGGGVAAGTAVFGGLVVGPAILVAGLVALKKAGDIENQVEKHIAELDIDEANKQRLIAALDAVLARVAEVKGEYHQAEKRARKSALFIAQLAARMPCFNLNSSLRHRRMSFFTYWWVISQRHAVSRGQHDGLRWRSTRLRLSVPGTAFGCCEDGRII